MYHYVHTNSEAFRKLELATIVSYALSFDEAHGVSISFDKKNNSWYCICDSQEVLTLNAV